VAAVERALGDGVEQAGTTAPAGSTSMRRSPPVMSFTFLAKSMAYSWKMSFAGQVLCQRMLIGPCALTMDGKPRVAAPVAAAAAPVRNLRREAGDLSFSMLILCLLLGSLCWPGVRVPGRESQKILPPASRPPQGDFTM
jgi:hypothetical protein